MNESNATHATLEFFIETTALIQLTGKSIFDSVKILYTTALFTQRGTF
jgi:hypothetical protein